MDRLVERTDRHDGPAAPGMVVEVDDRYVHIYKPSKIGGNGRRVRVLRSAVFADGRERRTGYSVVEGSR